MYVLTYYLYNYIYLFVSIYFIFISDLLIHINYRKILILSEIIKI